MLKRFLVIVVMGILIPALAMGYEIAGVNLPDSLPAGKESLVLNGAGIRKKLFLKLYVAGLYVKEKTSNAEKILNEDVPVAIRLHIISRLISSKNMEKATREGFEKATQGNLAGLEERIDEFISLFKSEPIKKHDEFDFIYVPGEGVHSIKNGKELKLIKGTDFKKALFGIWLSDNCVQEDLRDALLGK